MMKGNVTETFLLLTSALFYQGLREVPIQHDHHHESLTTTHIHVDHQNCLEVLVIKGKTGEIQKLSDSITALKGIKHSELVLTTTSL